MPREHDVVRSTDAPRTRESLAKGLLALGLRPGMAVIVHTALSSLGWIIGGPVALVQALMDALTPEGTLVMPAHSGYLSEPSYWCNPPVPESWFQTIRDTMPAYEPEITPTGGIGAVPEVFRNFPGVLRSAHPAVSFTAWGRHARFITENHSMDYPLGDGSPLARLYDLDGSVLLIGVGHDRNTSIHLAEYRSGALPPQRQGAPVLAGGKRVWMEYDDLDSDSDSFPPVGADFEAGQAITTGFVGSAQCRLIRQRDLVDFASAWFKHRSQG